MLFPGGATTNGPQLETRKALLLIDLQNEFVDPKGKLPVANTADFLPRLSTLVASFREKGDVVWIRTEYVDARPIYSPATGSYVAVLKDLLDFNSQALQTTNADLEDEALAHLDPRTALLDGPVKLSKQDPEAFLSYPNEPTADMAPCCLPRSAGCEYPAIVEAAIDHHADMYIVKSHYSAFQDASLLLQLRMQLVTELYICGSLSNVSVYATVLDAVMHGMAVTIVEDCVGYRDEQCHQEAMRQMADNMGANGIDYQELLDDLAGLLGDVVNEDDYPSRYEVAFQRGLESQEGPSRVRDVSAWMSKLEDHPSNTALAQAVEESFAQENAAIAAADDQDLLKSDVGSTRVAQREETPDSPPRKRPTDDDPELEERESKSQHTACCRRASHEGHTAESLRARPNRVRARRRRPQLEARVSPTSWGTAASLPAQSKSTGDLPDSTSAASAASTLLPVPSFTSGDHLQTTRKARLKKKVSHPLGPGDCVGIGDSCILYDLLPEDSSNLVFAKLKEEVKWEKMYHRSGEVPRLVAVQGDTSAACQDDESRPNMVPIYRHPADRSPTLLPLTSTVQTIREAAEKKVKHPLNHVLIQLYRTGEDNISEHSDKTLDIVRGSKIVNYSAGAMRKMILKRKKSPVGVDADVTAVITESEAGKITATEPSRTSQRIPMPHNSLFMLGPCSNQAFLHSIRADKRPASEKSPDELAYNGERISLTFRHIGTFIDRSKGTIWGQGASAKEVKDAKKIPEGEAAEREGERMIRAFGQQNHLGHKWNWEEWYGGGFDVVDFAPPQREGR